MGEIIDYTEIGLQSLNRAFLVGAYKAGSEASVCEDHLDELERLCESYGLEVVGRLACPMRKMDAGTYLGSGKLEEIKGLAEAGDAQVVIFDDEIAPKQQRNLEKLFNKPTIDRTELIIEVFAQRAQTREARLQVELARVKYLFPRLRRMWTHLSRQTSGGGGFTKGEGEKQIEIDRRLLRRRIDKLNKDLQEVRAQREIQRRQRKRTGIPTFAIVGYTNAGKSTLLNALTEAEVLVEDRLFATLDTTTRRFTLPNNQQILLIDTVGFIRKIPHTLVAAFKSTLEEAVHTDILLHLIDASSPHAEEQGEEAIKVIEHLGAGDEPTITVLNKVDAVQEKSQLLKLRVKFPRTVQVSATTREGFDQLLELMQEEISKLRKTVKLRIPQSHYALVSELMKDGQVISQEFDENDILMEVEIPSALEHKVAPFYATF